MDYVDFLVVKMPVNLLKLVESNNASSSYYNKFSICKKTYHKQTNYATSKNVEMIDCPVYMLLFRTSEDAP